MKELQIIFSIKKIPKLNYLVFVFNIPEKWKPQNISIPKNGIRTINKSQKNFILQSISFLIKTAIDKANTDRKERNNIQTLPSVNSMI